jgi:hypothetical protein
MNFTLKELLIFTSFSPAGGAISLVSSITLPKSTEVNGIVISPI